MSSEYSTSLFSKMHLFKVAQAVVSVVVLALCIWDMSVMDFNGFLVANATTLLSLGILVYYTISLRTPADIYKLFILVGGELLSIAAWMATCAALVAIYTVLLSYDLSDWPNAVDLDWQYDDGGCGGDYACHEMLEFMSRDAAETFGPVLGVALIFSVVQVVLFSASLVFSIRALYEECKGMRSVKLEDNVSEVRRFEKLE